MVLKEPLIAGFNQIVKQAGTQFRIRRFTTTIGSVYDDDIALVQDTDVFLSGVVLPIDARRGSFDSVLVEQGKLIENDQRLFMHGSISLTGSEQIIRIGLGSPPTEEYSIIPDGAIRAEVEGTPIYKKVFIRKIGGTGSLLGEV